MSDTPTSPATVGAAPTPRHATVAGVEPDAVVVILDDGTRSVVASHLLQGLRLVRPGQRLVLEQSPEGGWASAALPEAELRVHHG